MNWNFPINPYLGGSIKLDPRMEGRNIIDTTLKSPKGGYGDTNDNQTLLDNKENKGEEKELNYYIER
jgi:hypothetical protein